MKFRYVVITVLAALFVFVIYKVLSKKHTGMSITVASDDRKKNEQSGVDDAEDISEREKVINSMNEKNSQAEKVLKQTASEMKNTLDYSEKNKKDISEMMKKLKG